MSGPRDNCAGWYNGSIARIVAQPQLAEPAARSTAHKHLKLEGPKVRVGARRPMLWSRAAQQAAEPAAEAAAEPAAEAAAEPAAEAAAEPAAEPAASSRANNHSSQKWCGLRDQKYAQDL